MSAVAVAGGSLCTLGDPGQLGPRLGFREASASVSVAVSLEDLARSSSVIARVTPLERTSAWDDGRIVTITRLRVDDVVAGATPDGAREVRVRTLGGRVGEVGQRVEGEALLVPSEPCFVFLGPFEGRSAQPALVVVGRAQGQLLVRRDVHGRAIVRVGAVGALVERRTHPPLRAAGKPVVELDGAPLEAVALEARRAWEIGHAK